MVDFYWEKKQFEKWAILKGEKMEMLVPDDKIHFDWSVSHCPELVNDSAKQRGFYVLSLRDYWAGWLARAELAQRSLIVIDEAANMNYESFIHNFKLPKNATLIQPKNSLKMKNPFYHAKCGKLRKLHVGVKHKCPKKK